MKIEDFLKENINNLNNRKVDFDKLGKFFEIVIKTPILFLKAAITKRDKGCFSVIILPIILAMFTIRFPVIPYFETGYLNFLILIVNMWLLYFIFIGLMMIYSRLQPDSRFRKKIIKKYIKKMPHGITFSRKKYIEAAKVLKEFKSVKKEKALEKYGEEIIDILLIANGIWLNEGKFKRLVSIKAIEEDREAGPKDD